MTTNINTNGSIDVEHLLRAANDALTDDMVTRIAQTAADGMDLIDKVNRSGLDRALPALTSLVDNGDLDRLVRLARVYGSAEDALSDDIVGRVAEAVGEGLSMLDRLNRGGAGRLIGMIERMEADGSLERLIDTLPRVLGRLEQVDRLLAAVEQAELDTRSSLPNKGGVSGMIQLFNNAENQEALRHLCNLGKALGRGKK
jgi:hypothetical protein